MEGGGEDVGPWVGARVGARVGAWAGGRKGKGMLGLARGWQLGGVAVLGGNGQPQLRCVGELLA